MPFRATEERKVFDGAVIDVVHLKVEAPDGEVLNREVVRHPGAVVVVPVDEAGNVTLLRQYRAAVGGELLEIPAGKRDVDGEDPEVTAERELAEEIGRRPGRLDLLARFYNSPGFSDEFTYLYLARDLSEVPSDRQGAEEMAMTVETVALSDAPALIRDGRIVDAKSIIGLCMAKEFLAG
jgi:8-oxo-dGTP pyrophosphatase MutT (NUDIX family)